MRTIEMFELRRILPVAYWRDFNDLLVVHGQNVCTPVSPRCSECLISGYYRKAGGHPAEVNGPLQA